MTSGTPISKLALVVGGGPAPGINGVISAVTIEAINHGVQVVGVQDGFKWLVQGNCERIRNLTINDVKAIHLRGGSILGTSRTNPAKCEADMRNVLDAEDLDAVVDGLDGDGADDPVDAGGRAAAHD